MKVRRSGAYIVKAAEARPAKVTPKHGPLPVPTEHDRALARAVLAHHRRQAK